MSRQNAISEFLAKKSFHLFFLLYDSSSYNLFLSKSTYHSFIQCAYLPYLHNWGPLSRHNAIYAHIRRFTLTSPVDMAYMHVQADTAFWHIKWVASMYTHTYLHYKYTHSCIVTLSYMLTIPYICNRQALVTSIQDYAPYFFIKLNYFLHISWIIIRCTQFVARKQPCFCALYDFCGNNCINYVRYHVETFPDPNYATMLQKLDCSVARKHKCIPRSP